MIDVIVITEPARIERFFRRDVALHLYELGDLDPFFWPHTQWFGSTDGSGELRALTLLYKGGGRPVFIALGRDDGGAMDEHVRAVAPRLPEQLDAHMSPGLLECLGGRWSPVDEGRHLKMALRDRNGLSDVVGEDPERLGIEDLEAIHTLYRASYPGNWFDPRMLETEQYFGIRRGGALVCVAGVHVYSRAYRVAALGNIATHPAWCGQGLARRAVARLCRSLLEHVEVIGLNVKADNHAAIACYAGLGFAEIARYDEYRLIGMG
jgi:GNAT superfamily N-acetyltransferase